MLWFRNLIFYRFEPPAGLTQEHLEQALASHPFKPCGSQELSSSGWNQPVQEAEDMLVFSSNGFLLINLAQEERILPASVIREQLDERVALIEAEQSRKVYRKEKLQLKDEVVLDLLPRSFTRRKRTEAILMPQQGWIVVNASSHKRAEELLNQLRQALGSLTVRLPLTQISADKVMTAWLQGEAMPQGWALEDECELRDPTTEGSKISAKGQDLLCDEISAHITAGMLVKRLALEWQQQIRFVLHEDLSLHRLKLSDEYREQLDAEAPEDVLAACDAELARLGLEYARLLPELLQTLGGEAEH
ncbi:recombination-associated protein RdgC [Marinobacterium weihaiense]|uniref:Recombination-associated protein RdgC n=1 Tax=Marinobacterium weihaiense TaxID=2851016 RepID=A0ABS6M6R5_9GAMM|nr:recombination-associated protein RdgC [Marinobacterium weihaiense]MBV0931981.1 recombination-associated protein RdgC [Marinobacterium weihaiense]